MRDNFITKELRKDFPNMNYWNSKQTSELNKCYNCVAWVSEINNDWIWPDIVNKTVFINLFKSYGYKEIQNGNISLEPYKQKIAIYVDSFNKPSHVARQLRNGKWTSKIGRNIDIEHDNLEVLEGPLYGRINIMMEKRINVL
jgi:hypothetical protein